MEQCTAFHIQILVTQILVKALGNGCVTAPELCSSKDRVTFKPSLNTPWWWKIYSFIEHEIKHSPAGDTQCLTSWGIQSEESGIETKCAAVSFHCILFFSLCRSRPLYRSWVNNVNNFFLWISEVILMDNCKNCKTVKKKL